MQRKVTKLRKGNTIIEANGIKIPENKQERIMSGLKFVVEALAKTLGLEWETILQNVKVNMIAYSKAMLVISADIKKVKNCEETAGVIADLVSLTEAFLKDIKEEQAKLEDGKAEIDANKAEDKDSNQAADGRPEGGDL